MKKSTGIFSKIKYWILLNCGVLLMSAGVYFFKAPNGFATGGVSGISIILSKVIPDISQAQVMLIINVLLLFLGFAVLGKECGGKTVYCSLAFSLETWLLEMVLPLDAPLTDQPLLELVYAILLTGIGSAIIFNCSASSGGTDIIALILKKYTSLDVGKALLAVDFFVACSTFFAIGVKAGLYSVLGLFAKAFLIDGVIESLNVCKSFTIITTSPDAIADYIITELHRGVTEYAAKGEYTGENKTVLLTVCPRNEGVKLRNTVKMIDPSAFVIVTNTSEIIGRGFRSV